jgi:hypothetical protein
LRQCQARLLCIMFRRNQQKEKTVVRTKKRFLPRFLGLVFCVVSLAGSAARAAAWALQRDERVPVAVLGAIWVFVLLIGLATYVYMAICLQTIARKTNTENGWLAWIPIANLILMLQIAHKPIWWILLLLIPLVNVVVAVLVWMGIAKARGKPDWWGILMIIPVVNLVVPGYLAFSN